jgi:transposase
MYYVGLDIHKPFTYGVIKDAEGNVVKEEKFDNTETDFGDFFEGIGPKECKIVMESTCVWEHIHGILESKGYSAKLANPVKTRAIAEARIKTDKVDANILADLLRANMVAECYIPPKEVRLMREMVRSRKALVRTRTQMINKIRAVLMKKDIKLPTRFMGKKSIRWLKENEFEEFDLLSGYTYKDTILSYLNVVEEVNNQLKFVEKKIGEIAEKSPEAKLIMTIPGIGEIRAIEILAEIGDIKRFEDSNKLCSYAGLVPGIRQSGNTLRFGRLIKQASKSLKGVMIEASWTATRAKEANSLQIYYKRLAKKKGKQKAICATARKMLTVIHAMLRKNEVFAA